MNKDHMTKLYFRNSPRVEKEMVGYGFDQDGDFTSVKSFTVVNNGAQR